MQLHHPQLNHGSMSFELGAPTNFDRMRHHNGTRGARALLSSYVQFGDGHATRGLRVPRALIEEWTS